MKNRKTNKAFNKETCNRRIQDMRDAFVGIDPAIDHPLIQGTVTQENIFFQRGIVYAACYAYEESYGSIEYPLLRHGIKSLVSSVDAIESIFFEHDLEAFKEHKGALDTFKKRLIALDVFIELT